MVIHYELIILYGSLVIYVHTSMSYKILRTALILAFGTLY